MVSNIFYFHPYLGKINILTNIFQRGWNHQLENIHETMISVPNMCPLVSLFVCTCFSCKAIVLLMFLDLLFLSTDDIHHHPSSMTPRAKRHRYLTLQRAQMTWTLILGLIKFSFPTSPTRITDKLWSKTMWSWFFCIGLMQPDLSKRWVIPSIWLFSSWCSTTICRCFETSCESQLAFVFHPNSPNYPNCQYFLKVYQSWIPDLNHSRTTNWLAD